MKSTLKNYFRDISYLTISVLLTFLLCPALINAQIDSKIIQTYEEDFGGNIVLGRPTDTSITINVYFDVNQDDVHIRYGTDQGSLDQETTHQTNIKTYVTV